MFDDLNQKPDVKSGNGEGPAMPAGQAEPKPAPGRITPVEDMFAETEPAKPEQFRPKEAPAPPRSLAVDSGPSGPDSEKIRKILILTAIAAGILAAAILAYWLISRWLEPVEEEFMPDSGGNYLQSDTDSPEETASQGAVPESGEAFSGENQPPVPDNSRIKDGDQDGLSDAEEFELGTDALSSDTDGDGLYDREEVRTYKTDPLDPDTDDDGFSDGDEVKNGYNPRGEGKLYSLDH